MGMRHVHRGAFVSHVHDPNAPLPKQIPDRLDMRTLQTENPVDSAGFQKIDNKLCNGARLGDSHRVLPLTVGRP